MLFYYAVRLDFGKIRIIREEHYGFYQSKSLTGKLTKICLNKTELFIATKNKEYYKEKLFYDYLDYFFYLSQTVYEKLFGKDIFDDITRIYIATDEFIDVLKYSDKTDDYAGEILRKTTLNSFNKTIHTKYNDSTFVAGGYSIEENNIIIIFSDSKLYDFFNEDWAPYTLAHEYFHQFFGRNVKAWEKIRKKDINFSNLPQKTSGFPYVMETLNETGAVLIEDYLHYVIDFLGGKRDRKNVKNKVSGITFREFAEYKLSRMDFPSLLNREDVKHFFNGTFSTTRKNKNITYNIYPYYFLNLLYKHSQVSGPDFIKYMIQGDILFIDTLFQYLFEKNFEEYKNWLLSADF